MSSDTTAAACPFCGTETGLERTPEPRLGAVSATELETLVRNEWRRRLGPDTYGRPHSRVLVRSLLLHGLDPRDPEREAAATEVLDAAITGLLEDGLGRREAWGEVLRLSQAIWEVLCWTELEFDRIWALMDRIDRTIHETVGWLEPAEPGIPDPNHRRST